MSPRARFLPVVLYTATAIALTWPLAAHLASSVAYADGAGDSFQFLWNLWWVKTAIGAGENPLYTRLLFWPEGTSLAFHTLSASNGLLSVPLQLLVPGPAGVIASLNLLTIAAFALAGLGAHLLARDAGASHFGACVAGLMAVTLPYRLWHLNHLNLLSTPWGLFTLLAFHRAVRTRTRGPMIAAALLAVLTTFADYETALATAIVAFVVLLWERFTAPDAAESAAITRAAATVMVMALVLHLPLLWSLWELQQVDAVTSPDPYETEVASVNLLGFVLPGPESLLFHRWQPAPLPVDHGVVGGQAFLGVFFLVALIINVGRAASRATWMWLTAGVVLLLLSLGPVLHFGNASLFYDEMPYSWLKVIFPLLGFGRDPVHLVAMMGDCLAIALGSTFRAAEVEADARSPMRTVLAAALVLLLVLERWPSTAPVLQEARVPEVYAAMASEPSGAALMQLPTEHVHRKVYMFWQTVHGRPITDAFVARETRNSGRWRAAYEATADEAEKRRLLRTAGIGAVVHHPTDPNRLFDEAPRVDPVPAEE